MSAPRTKSPKRQAATPTLEETLRKIENAFHRGVALVECAALVLNYECVNSDACETLDAGLELIRAAQKALDDELTQLARRARP